MSSSEAPDKNSNRYNQAICRSCAVIELYISVTSIRACLIYLIKGDGIKVKLISQYLMDSSNYQWVGV